MSPSKTKRCAFPGCNHGQGFHYEKRGAMPAFCRACKGGKALHQWREEAPAEVPA